jgi:hypothetical protein
MLAGLGLWAGVGTSTGRYSERWEPAAASRNPRDLPKSRLPRFPRGLFLALLFATFPFFRGWCPGFLNQHGVFTFIGIFCLLSTATWLLIAFLYQSFADRQRTVYIDQFVSDPHAAIPPKVLDSQDSPVWMKAWNWGNSFLFLILIAIIARALIALPAS